MKEDIENSIFYKKEEWTVTISSQGFSIYRKRNEVVKKGRAGTNQEKKEAKSEKAEPSDNK